MVHDISQASTSSSAISTSVTAQMSSLLAAGVEREQLDPSLYTMSGLPPSRWAGLPILDQIRQRNKPKEPPKKPKSAPFFLPTVDTLGGFHFDKKELEKLREADEAEGDAQKGNRPIAIASRRLEMPLQSKWQKELLRFQFFLLKSHFKEKK